MKKRMATLADRLRQARSEAGYASASEAARAYGWNLNTYRSAENNSRRPSKENLIQYARAYRVGVDWLLTGRKAANTGKSGGRQVPVFRFSDLRGRTRKNLRAFLLHGPANRYIVMPDSEVISSDMFAVEIIDVSMVDPAASSRSLYPGDLVLIDPLRKPTAGSIVLAEIGNDTGIAVRRLRIVAQAEDGMLQHVAFIPLNPDFPTIEGAGSCILGVRTGMFRPEPENP